LSCKDFLAAAGSEASTPVAIAAGIVGLVCGLSALYGALAQVRPFGPLRRPGPGPQRGLRQVRASPRSRPEVAKRGATPPWLRRSGPSAARCGPPQRFYATPQPRAPP
jgi:hypothetical protein